MRRTTISALPTPGIGDTKARTASQSTIRQTPGSRPLPRSHAHRQPRRHHPPRPPRPSSLADRIACEDTRQTQKLLNHFDLHTPTVSYHLFNEGEPHRRTHSRTQSKGPASPSSPTPAPPASPTPAPSSRRLAIAAGVPVFPIPGANAALSALIASGLSAESPLPSTAFSQARSGPRRSSARNPEPRPPSPTFSTRAPTASSSRSPTSNPPSAPLSPSSSHASSPSSTKSSSAPPSPSSAPRSPPTPASSAAKWFS